MKLAFAHIETDLAYRQLCPLSLLLVGDWELFPEEAGRPHPLDHVPRFVSPLPDAIAATWRQPPVQRS